MIKLQRIVCPTDFSETSAQAIDYATTLASSLDAELILLHVIPELNYPLRSFGMTSSFPQLQDELKSKAKAALEELSEQLRGKAPALATRHDLRRGDAHAAVLACAEEHQADMIVMGTHGHTGLTHALLGSTAEKVVRTATCPVLTVRTPQ